MTRNGAPLAWCSTFADCILVSIVFVHGLQGNSRDTWTHKALSGQGDKSKVEVEKKKQKPRLTQLFRVQRQISGPKTTTEEQNAVGEDSVFWPECLLPVDFPDARILTYGYDTQISNFFKGPANQSHILAQGRDFLNQLEA